MQKDILDNFFGSGRLLEDTQYQAIDDTGVAIVEFFESIHIPLQKPPHERHVGRRSTRFRGCEDRKEHFRASSSPARYTTNPAKWMRRRKRGSDCFRTCN